MIIDHQAILDSSDAKLRLKRLFVFLCKSIDQGVFSSSWKIDPAGKKLKDYFAKRIFSSEDYPNLDQCVDKAIKKYKAIVYDDHTNDISGP
jgi:hypothetical protein